MECAEEVRGETERESMGAKGGRSDLHMGCGGAAGRRGAGERRGLRLGRRSERQLGVKGQNRIGQVGNSVMCQLRLASSKE